MVRSTYYLNYIIKKIKIRERKLERERLLYQKFDGLIDWQCQQRRERFQEQEEGLKEQSPKENTSPLLSFPL